VNNVVRVIITRQMAMIREGKGQWWWCTTLVTSLIM
jgi:hypothetical protein